MTKRGRSTRISPALLKRWRLPELDGAAGKVGRGTVLVVGGSHEIPGAVVLAATAALRAGAGRVTVATGRTVAPLVAMALPEARVIGLAQSRNGELRPLTGQALRRLAAGCSSILIGPGVMSDGAGAALLDACLASRECPPLVVDAGALAALKSRRRRGAPRAVIATPHAGEMAGLWGASKEEVLADPQQLAARAADELGIVMVLKGEETHVVGPDATAFHNDAGNIGLGTSGSGDTLSGLIAGLCARGAEPLQAAVWGVYLHARAGDRLAATVGPVGYLARELLAEIPRLLARLDGRR
jgi:ADP-dependent NAD(P)H-hydrate dehydratase